MTALLASWVDGIPSNTVPVDDRGLQYGDGVFETILVRAGIARFLDAHVARLTHGLAALGIPFVEEAALRADVAEAARIAPPLAILKIVVTRGSRAARGYAPRGAGAARRIVTLWATEPLERAEAGVTVYLPTLRLSDTPRLAGLKHLNRLENVMAAAESLDSSAFETLLLDARDEVVSAASSNLFVLRAMNLVTPRLDRAGVRGILRGVVLREAPRLGFAVVEQTLTLGDVIRADAVFLTNARIGVVPVRLVGEHPIPMSDLVLKLRKRIETLDA